MCVDARGAFRLETVYFVIYERARRGGENNQDKEHTTAVNVQVIGDDY